MSGPAALMDLFFLPRLKLLMVFLLVFINTERLNGSPVSVSHSLKCVSDYVYTINCSLNIPPTGNTSEDSSSHWLTVMELSKKKKSICMLMKRDEDFFCSVQISEPITFAGYDVNAFLEGHTYEIKLCHKQNDTNETCEPLTNSFKPFKNIKPNPPCCLTLSHESGQHHFTWKSTYEKYSSFTTLHKNLEFQLEFYKRGDILNIRPHPIITVKTNFSVGYDHFLPDTEYSARVRSSPNQAYFKGNWSSWSSEIHWRTNASVNGVTSNTLMPGLGKIFLPLCAVVLLILPLCYAPVKKWKQRSFIPTPAPYFHSLYHDCQGDFKSWVVTQENTADVLKVEETLQIDTITKCADIQREEEEAEEEEEVKEAQSQCQHVFMAGSTYINITNPACDSSLLGVPYAVSNMSAALSNPGSSLKSLTFSSAPGSPEEGDSGCWLSSHTSLEREPPWYCNEYCTLSAFQQIQSGGPEAEALSVTAEGEA